jgi:hypothetical protein
MLATALAILHPSNLVWGFRLLTLHHTYELSHTTGSRRVISPGTIVPTTTFYLERFAPQCAYRIDRNTIEPPPLAGTALTLSNYHLQNFICTGQCSKFLP